MDINYYKQYEPIFGSWYITRLIGEGSFGKVFEMEREDFGVTCKAALKAITIPASQSEMRSVMDGGTDAAEAHGYLEGCVRELVEKIALVRKLRGSNVVSYEDHQVIEHKDGVGWDILIQMELLTPLNSYIQEKKAMSRQEIIKLGIDLCKALELCQKYNIIHRDIKPENIFVSDNGDFKLGDFGIARTIDRTVSGLSKKGTFNFMAPEVYRGEAYGFSVDLYSLGLVLYRLLNRNRLPFLPAPPEPISYRQREQALALRMGGKALPVPVHAQGRLGEIILKACAFDPNDRYESPSRMRADLEAILYEEQDAALIYPDGDELTLSENQYLPNASSREVSLPKEENTAPVFGGGQESSFQPNENTDATVHIFSHAAESKTDSGTVSVFRSPSDPPKTPSSKQEKKRAKPALLAGVAAAIVIAAAAGLFVWNSSRVQQENEQTYLTLMNEGTALCSDAPEQAAEKFLAAQSLRPDAPEPYLSYAYTLYLCGEYESCISYIENDLALGKSYDETVQSELAAILGAAYFEQEDYAAAASFFRLSTAGGDITIDEMRDYAVSLGRLGDVDAADKVLEGMRTAGASGELLDYVQAETDLAKGSYSEAEHGFLFVLDSTQDRVLQTRSLRSLAELYLACAALDVSGSSPIPGSAAVGRST